MTKEAATQETKPRKVPERMCVGCRAMKPKKALIRVVAPAEGPVSVDRTGRMQGRGAYLCPDRKCLEQALKGKRLDKALKKALDPAAAATLAQMLEVPDARTG
jgi:uncharacterized protein